MGTTKSRSNNLTVESKYNKKIILWKMCQTTIKNKLKSKSLSETKWKFYYTEEQMTLAKAAAAAADGANGR